MVIYEVSELIFSYECSESTATYGTISFKKNLKSDWGRTTHQANEKKPTRKQVREARTQSCHKLHPQHGVPQMERNSKSSTPPWGVKGLNPTLGISTFETYAWEMSTQNIYLWKPRKLCPETQKTMTVWEAAFKWSHSWTHLFQGLFRGSQLFPGWKWRFTSIYWRTGLKNRHLT